MQTEELFVRTIFSNQMLFCGLFGALGGVVHSLDLRTDISVGTIASKVIVSSSAGLLLFFSTYDLSLMTPSLRIAASIVSGFYGSALFRYLAKIYLKQAPGLIASNNNLKNKDNEPSDEVEEQDASDKTAENTKEHVNGHKAANKNHKSDKH